jgi:hypothetical protein
VRAHNPFLGHPETRRAAAAYTQQPGWSEALHEYPLLALEIESLVKTPDHSPLPMELVRYAARLTENSRRAPSLLIQLRAAAALPGCGGYSELGERMESPASTAELLFELYGIPRAISLRLLDEKSLIVNAHKPVLWNSIPTNSKLPSFRTMFEELGVTIVDNPRWQDPFSVVTRLGESYLFAARLEPEHPFEAAALVHEMAHIRHLLAANRPLGELTPWERELNAIRAEHQYLATLGNKNLLREWFRLTLEENRKLLAAEVELLRANKERDRNQRLPLSIALYAGAALTIHEQR